MQYGELPPPDYFAALDVKGRMAQVVIAATGRQVQRARLGLHHRLLAVYQDDSLDPIDRALAYISLACGCPIEDIQASEIAEAMDKLMVLNAPQQIPAIQRHTGPNDPIPAGLQYPGRHLANIVHDLAFYYGWTPGYILTELGPEEAMLYVQEIAHQVHQDRRFLYNLSDIGRDKTGKQKAFPDLPWLKVPYTRPRSSRVPDVAKPTGTVIRLDDYAKVQRG